MTDSAVTDSKLQQLPVLCYADLDQCPPLGVFCSALPKQIDQHLTDAIRVGIHWRKRKRQFGSQGDLFLGKLRAHPLEAASTIRQGSLFCRWIGICPASTRESSCKSCTRRCKRDAS